VSNFDDVKEVRITLKIASKALYFMAYSTYQEWLFEKVCYRTMTLRINTELRDIEAQLSTTRSDLDSATNGKKWLNWLKTFGQEITDLDSRSDEQKKAYIEGLVKQIDVRWNAEEREHELTLTFFLPIVNDGITWREKEDYEGHGRRARRYDTYEGSTKTTLSAKKKDGRG